MNEQTKGRLAADAVRKAEDLIAEAEQMMDAMDRLYSRAGVSREACREFLRSDRITPEQKEQIEQELTALQAELDEVSRKTSERQRPANDEPIRMGAGVFSV